MHCLSTLFIVADCLLIILCGLTCTRLVDPLNVLHSLCFIDCEHLLKPHFLRCHIITVAQICKGCGLPMPECTECGQACCFNKVLPFESAPATRSTFYEFKSMSAPTNRVLSSRQYFISPDYSNASRSKAWCATSAPPRPRPTLAPPFPPTLSPPSTHPSPSAVQFFRGACVRANFHLSTHDVVVCRFVFR